MQVTMQSRMQIDLQTEQQNARRALFGDNSVSLRRIWMKLWGISSYNPPGASYTAQRPEKQPAILKSQLYIRDQI